MHPPHLAPPPPSPVLRHPVPVPETAGDPPESEPPEANPLENNTPESRTPQDRTPADNEERRNPAGFIYGVLAVATVIAAESTRRETLGKLLAAGTITLVLYWVAHAYAHHWASRLSGDGDWNLREFLHSLSREATILAGAALPLAVMVVAWMAGASLKTDVTAVLWFAIAEIVVLELVVGLRRHASARELTLDSMIGIGLGVGILAVRVLLH